MALTKVGRLIDKRAIKEQTNLGAEAADTDEYLLYDADADALKAIQSQNVVGTGLITNKTEDTNTALDDFILVFDTSAGAFKKASRSTFVGIPTVSSVSPSNLLSGDGTGNYTIVITGSGFLGGSAKLKTDGGTDIGFDTVAVDSNTQITGVVAKNKANLTNANEPFDVVVTGATGASGTLENAINIDAQPIFSTGAGSLGTIAAGAGSQTFTVVAADPESAGDIVYTLESGSIPAGMSFSSTSSGAVISGTASEVGSNTTSNFTIRAKDAASNTSDRAFSILKQAPTVQTFTSSGTFSVPSGVSSVQVLVVAGGGSGGAAIGGGGGAGGLVYHAGYPVTPGGTETVTVGEGGAGVPGSTPSSPSTGNPGNNSTFGTITANGGGAGGSRRCGPYQGSSGAPGGSGGGGSSSDHSPSHGGGSATQGQTGSPAGQGYGNNGGSGKQRFPHGSGGGGGAGAAATSANNPTGVSAGGIGLAYTIADGSSPVYYAGGGAGVTDHNPGSGTLAQSGGQGGGGPSQYNVVNAPGTANRGGGGGGSSYPPAPAGGPTSASGGKGVVIVRWG